MLTLKDCIALCELDEDEIAAIAKHEHLPEILAVELAEYLVHCDDGITRIRRMIEDDLEQAKNKNNLEAVNKYRQVLKHFIAVHPERNEYLAEVSYPQREPPAVG